MNIVKNVPIKQFLELSNKCEIANQKLKQLENNLDSCFKITKINSVTQMYYDHDVIFLEDKFDSLIANFNKEIPLKDKFSPDVEEYLNYQMDVDIKVYMNMVETINQYIDKKLYHKTLVTIEEKEKYARFMVEGVKTKRNIEV